MLEETTVHYVLFGLANRVGMVIELVRGRAPSRARATIHDSKYGDFAM